MKTNVFDSTRTAIFITILYVFLLVTLISTFVFPANSTYSQNSGTEVLLNHHFISTANYVTGFNSQSAAFPASFMLDLNYPNPFNPTIITSYQLPAGNYTTLKIYNVVGHEIATMIDEYKPAGNFFISFNTNGLPIGAYIDMLRSWS